MRKKQTLADDFIVPPYSVFDCRMGYWKNRKKMWKEWLGITNETRENTLYDNLEMKLPALYQSSKAWREEHNSTFEDYVRRFVPDAELEKLATTDTFNGASSFDPVLAEIACQWFTPGEGSAIFDCFAGGVTKGAVACKLGHSFFGTELRPEQVKANNAKARTIGVSPQYVADNGSNIGDYLGVCTQDLLLSCPPYFNLEVYSDNADDLSNQPDYNTFILKLGQSYQQAIKCLKRNRFAVVVVGDIRDAEGGCYNFPGDVISIFERNGCMLWNDIAIIGNDATVKLRARQYMNNRKVARMHQRMLVFYNGRPRAIPKFFKKIRRLTSNIAI